jgi:hypothetical protein
MIGDKQEKQEQVINEILYRLSIDKTFDELVKNPSWSLDRTIRLAKELYERVDQDAWEIFWARKVVEKSVERHDFAEIRHWIRVWLCNLDRGWWLKIENGEYSWQTGIHQAPKERRYQ